jgi:hypothetical protein
MIRKGRLEVKLGGNTIVHAKEKKNKKTPLACNMKPAPLRIRP